MFPPRVTKLFFKMAASAFELVAKKRIFERFGFSIKSQISVGSYCFYILSTAEVNISRFPLHI